MLSEHSIMRSGRISRKKSVLPLIAAAVITVSVSSYYLLMPAWVIASRVDEDARPFEGGVYQVTDDDLARFPALREAMVHADEAGADSRWIPPTKASYIEGRIMMEQYNMHFALEHAAILIHGDKHYYVELVFDYERPVQL